MADRHSMQQPAPAVPPREPWHLWRKRVVVFAASVSLLTAALCGSVCLWLSSDAYLTRALGTLVAPYVSGHVQLGRAHWLWPVGLRLEQIRVAKSPQAQVLLNIDRVELRLSIRKFLAGRGLVTTIKAFGVDADLSSDPADPNSLPAGLLASAIAAPQKDQAQAVPSQPWTQILAHIPHGLVDVRPVTVRQLTRSEGRNKVLLASDVALFLGAKSPGDGTLTVTASANSQGAKLQARAYLTAQANTHAATLVAHVSGHVPYPELAPIAACARVPACGLQALKQAKAIDVELDVDGLVPANWHDTKQLAVALRASCADNVARDSIVGPHSCDRLHVQGLWQAPRLTITSADLTLDGATIAADGALDMLPSGDLSKLRLSLAAANAAPSQMVRRLARLGHAAPPQLHVPAKALQQLENLAAQLPGRLDVAAHIAGNSVGELKLSAWASASAIPHMAGFRPPQKLDLVLRATCLQPAISIDQLTLSSSDGRFGLNLRGQLPRVEAATVSLEGQLWAARPQLLLASRPPWGASLIRANAKLGGTWESLRGHGSVVGTGLWAKADAHGAKLQLGELTAPWSLTPRILVARNIRLAGAQTLARIDAAVIPDALGLWGDPSLVAELRVNQLSKQWASLGPGPTTLLAYIDGPARSPQAQVWLQAHPQLSLMPEQKDAVLPLLAASGSVSSAWIQLRALALRPGLGGILWAEGSVAPEQGPVELQIGSVDLHVPHIDTRGIARPTGAPMAVALEVTGSIKQQVTVTGELHHPGAALKGSGAWIAHQGPAVCMPNKGCGSGIKLAVMGHANVAEASTIHQILAPLGLSGQLDLQLHLDGETSLPKAQAWATLTGLARDGRPLGSGPTVLTIAPAAGRAYQIDLRDDGSLRADASVFVPPGGGWQVAAKLRQLSAHRWLPQLQGQGATLLLAGSADLRLKKGTAVRGNVQVTNFALTGSNRDLSISEPAFLQLDAQGMHLARTRLSGTGGSVVLQGKLGKNIALAFDGALDLALVAPFIPAVSQADGRLGLNIELAGTLKAPTGHASLRILQPLTLQPRGVPAEIRVSHGTIELRPNQLSVRAVRGELEGGTFLLEGNVGLNELACSSWNVRLQGSGLPLHSDELLLETNVRLTLRGPGTHPVLGGDIEVVGGRYLKQVRLRDFNFVAQKIDVQSPLALRAPWLRHLALDLHAKSPTGVEIGVDAGAFAVRSTLTCDLHLGGHALNPQVSGKILATQGQLHFPRGDLRLVQAQIDFEPARRSLSDPTGAEIALQAEGEISASSNQSRDAYLVSLHMDGTPKRLALDLSCDQGLSRLEILSLLTTGHVNVSDLAQGSQDQSKLDAALALAGSQVSEPITRFAEERLEQALNLELELGAEVTGGNVKVTAAKSISRRLRLEGAYSHALAAEQSSVSSRALLSLTDRLLLEGVTDHDLTGGNTSASPDSAMQSNLELKYRVVGE